MGSRAVDFALSASLYRIIGSTAQLLILFTTSFEDIAASLTLLRGCPN
jgi:hypothetical protein